MALDKLVDSTQLDADLTSVANAIRAKSGGSGQLAFPGGFVSEIGNIPSGGSAGSSFCVENYVMSSLKFCMQNAVPNLLASGGCIHYTFTLQTNSSTSEDKQILSVGYGPMNSWSPSNQPVMFVIVSRNEKRTTFYHRGITNGIGSIQSTGLADSNDKVDVKFYSDHYVDCNTNTSYSYSTAEQAFFTALASKSYLSISCSQSTPLTGAVVTRLAIEEA